jgi:hypothetical protein
VVPQGRRETRPYVALVRSDKFVYAMRAAGSTAEAVAHASRALAGVSAPERVAHGNRREPDLVG